MAPKKKGGNKKGGDDWEAELGETIAPAAASPTDAAADDEAEAGGGGLMNLMRKKKEKLKKKGTHEDWVEGENIEAEQPDGEPVLDLSAKTAEEGNIEDEFALPDKKGKGYKGGKGKQQGKPAAAAAKNEDEDGTEGGKVLTKAEKEKLKKEREKQRKKEQVRDCPYHVRGTFLVKPELTSTCDRRLPRRRVLLQQPRQRQRSPLSRKRRSKRRPLRQRPAARRRSSPPTCWLSRSSRRN
jgi:hypothetical protein